ncbi:hypothetical protein D3C87_58730 [compost metagenome]
MPKFYKIMKQKLLFILLLPASYCYSQSVIQTLNSGSIIGSASTISIGEIVVVPQNQNQSSSGIIGILTEINNHNLEVPQLDLTEKITVYPNPTIAKIFFDTSEAISNESVSIYNNTGQLVLTKKIDIDHSLDLTTLSSGIYLIQFTNKTFKTFKIIKH